MISRLNIRGVDVPIVDDIPISLNYVQADVREPDKRNASFSKTIQLYGTNIVNRLFENVFELNITTSTFNQNKKEYCEYFENEILIFKGDLQLLSIRLKPDNLIIYECNIVGQEGSLFVDIGEDLLSDLDFSAYDHTYNRTNVINSWSATAGTGYYYPFINRGSNGGSETVFTVKDFIPCFYAHEYLTKILSDKGYTFTSNLLDSTYFKRLIVYPNIDKLALTLAQVQNRQYNVGITSDFVLTKDILVSINHNDETGQYFDTGGQVSGTSATIANTGNYTICVSYNMNFSFTHTATSVTYCKTENLGCEIRIFVNGTPQRITSRLWGGSGGLVSFNKGQNYTEVVNSMTAQLNLNAGDVVTVQVAWYIIGGSNFGFVNTIRYYNASNVEVTTGTGTPEYKILSGYNNCKHYLVLNDKTTAEGDTLNVNNALPVNIKQKDFLKSIMQAFNLYIDYDRQNPKSLVIETYEDYFNQGVTNWENRIDKLNDVVINPNLLEAKRYIYRYKQDADYYNKLYYDTYNEPYGSYNVNVDTDFKKEDKINELIFSPTPLVQNYDLGIAMPKIYKNENGVVSTIVPNIRLLYAGGVRNTENDWTFNQLGLSGVLMNTYGYAGHVDDALSPTQDLNFGVAKELYYTYPSLTFTTNNLFQYHSKGLNNVTNRDSKIVTCNLWINAVELSLFTFRKYYFIDNCYYIVNKIIDYDPNTTKSTKVELIKVLEL